MKRNPFPLILAVVMAGLLAVPVTATAGSKYSTVNKGIRISDRSEAGDLDSVNGSIRVGEAAVVGSVESVNGGISIDDGSTVENVESVNGSIRLGSNVIVERGLDSVNGSISMEHGGEIGGEIETVNGGVRLESVKVAGGITTINGTINLQDGTEVMGDILVKEPRGWFNSKRRKPVKVIIGADTVVHGDLIFEHAVRLDLHESARVGEIIGDEIEYGDGELK